MPLSIIHFVVAVDYFLFPVLIANIAILKLENKSIIIGNIYKSIISLVQL